MRSKFYDSGYENLLAIMTRISIKYSGKKKITLKELRVVIDVICGIDDRTYKRYREALIRHGYIKTRGHYVELLRSDTEVSKEITELTEVQEMEMDIDKAKEEEMEHRRNRLFI